MCRQTICGCCGLDHKKNNDAREGQAAKCLVFGTFNHEFPQSTSSIAIDLLLPLCDQQLDKFSSSEVMWTLYTPQLPRISPTGSRVVSLFA